nr:serine hydrolase [Psychromicrobium silvestre]
MTSDYSDGVPVASYCLSTLAGEVLAERKADTRFYSASTIKLAVLVAAITAVERGELSLEQELISTHTFSSQAGGSFSFEPEEYDVGMAAEGATMTLREVLGRMISVSSNEATNLVVELVGFPAVMTALRACGATDSKMERLIGDITALEQGLTHEVTARDLCRVMGAIVRGEVANDEHTELMLGWLRAQEYPVIGTELSTFAPVPEWGSKSGWVTGIQHDVAFIFPASSVAANSAARQGFLLAICTRAYPEPDAAELIHALTQALLGPLLEPTP